MITIHLNDILNSIPIFRDISNQALPIKAAYQIARLIRELDKESSTFDESRLRIIDKYAEHEENGEYKQTPEGNVLIQPDQIEACNQEMSELLNTEIEINADPININMIESIELTPAQMLSLEPFFEN